MIIRYRDGTAVEAVILSASKDVMRVAVKDGDDVLVFRAANGTSISEELEPVQISFAWQRALPKPKVPLSESDCICSKELAARLIHLLANGGEESESTCHVPSYHAQDAIRLHVV